MSGFEGDLSDKQQLVLGQLKHRLSDIWKEELTDRLLLRFLRARDFDLGKAEKMLRECLIWRQQNNIDSLIETYECPEVLRRYFPGGLCNHDRDGRPLYIMRFGNGDFSGIAQCVSMDAIVKHAAYQIEVAIADMKTQTEKLKSRLRDIWNEEFVDPFLLRWLRAREFDVNKSEKLLRDNCRSWYWRILSFFEREISDQSKELILIPYDTPDQQADCKKTSPRSLLLAEDIARPNVKHK
ncbi:hypothetical protein HPB47_009929, partial [Ixodes persulcatus]